MAFKKGDPKPPNSGIKKGEKHKRTMLRVEELLLEQDVHPIKKLLTLIPTLDPIDQAHMWFRLMKYVEPELKPVEALLNVTPNENQQLLEASSTEELLALEANDETVPNAIRAVAKR